MDFITAYARQMDSMKHLKKQFEPKKQGAIDVEPKTMPSIRHWLARHLMRIAVRLEPELHLKDQKLNPNH